MSMQIIKISEILPISKTFLSGTHSYLSKMNLKYLRVLKRPLR